MTEQDPTVALLSFGFGQVGLWVAVAILMVRVWRLEHAKKDDASGRRR
jgi:hypothetical protein